MDSKLINNPKIADIEADLLEMASHLKEDIEKLRASESKELIGAEIMAVRELCNIYKTLKENEHFYFQYALLSKKG